MQNTQTYLHRLVRDLLLEESKQSLPKLVVQKTKLSLFDFISVLYCGDSYGVLNQISDKYFIDLGGKAEATCLPGLEKIPAVQAAFCTGVKSHSVELDDGHRYGTSHPAVAVIPAALALGERENSDISELLRAICFGYEVMLRTARSINPSHLKRGFHTTGTAGSLGAAMTAGIILKLNKEELCHAVSIAGLQSAGLQEMLHENPSIKPLQAGKAAQAGVISADLVKRGAKGPMTIFEGQHGWLKAMTDSFNENDLLADIGKRWEILNCYTKLYPTCRHCHQSIDIAIELFNENIDLTSIEKIQIVTYSVAISEVGGVFYPKNIEEAMFSLPFSFALGITSGKVRINDFIPNLENKEILDIVEKISISESQKMNELYPLERGVKIDISFKDAPIISRFLKLPKGEFDTPIKDEDYLIKALDITEGVVNPEKIKRIFDFIMSDCENIKVSTLIQMITKK
jgi:2-methylcitrate dehydratase PrpD